tara:strand:+ start:81 stop:290 length:210 start_codon:yes stop_codon:yes gene_type:complete
MIRLSIVNGEQSLQERCDNCGCYVRDLTTDDILIKPDWANSDTMLFRDSKGNEITGSVSRGECHCEDCN